MAGTPTVWKFPTDTGADNAIRILEELPGERLITVHDAAVGASIGGPTGAFAHLGIDDHFIARLENQITPGTSALFVLTSDATLDRVHERFAGRHAELISTNLGADQETKLREVFAD